MRRLAVGLLAGGVLLMPFYADNPFAIPDASVAVTVDSETTLVTGGSPDWHGRVSIKRWSTRYGGDDRLVLLYRDATGHNTDDAVLTIRFSDDNGATWTAANTKLGGGAVSGFPMEPTVGNISYGLGWLLIDPTGRLIIHMSSITGVSPTGTIHAGQQAFSIDGGETWSEPIVLTDGAGSNGDFIGHDGRLYGPGATPLDEDWDPVESWIYRMTPDGIIWDQLGQMIESGDTAQSAEMDIVESGENRLIAIIRDKPHTNTYQSISTDMGATWGAFTDITATVNRVIQPRVYPRAWLKGQDTWWQDPVLLMTGGVHTVSGDSHPRRNAVWVSRDAGATWSTPFYIDTEQYDGGYGDMFYDADNDQYVVINYVGPDLNSADVIQYRLTIDGI